MLIFGIHIYYIRSRQCVTFKMVASPCCLFELSPLNELYRGKLVRSITLVPFELF